MEIGLVLLVVFVLTPLVIFVGFGTMALYHCITGKEYEMRRLNFFR